jgi:hypothetical protein
MVKDGLVEQELIVPSDNHLLMMGEQVWIGRSRLVRRGENIQL